MIQCRDLFFCPDHLLNWEADLSYHGLSYSLCRFCDLDLSCLYKVLGWECNFLLDLDPLFLNYHNNLCHEVFDGVLLCDFW